MAISVGDRLPETTFMRFGEEGMEKIPSSQVFGGRKVALFGVPGAFTPTCHNKHVPGFLEKAEEFRAKGVDEIVCIAVNDPHVMRAWAKATGAEDTITFYSDGNGEFARATGLDLDASGGGMGLRLKRFSMIVEDGVVKSLNIEDAPGVAEKTSAQNLLLAL
jgi:peroxiredoxin